MVRGSWFVGEGGFPLFEREGDVRDADGGKWKWEGEGFIKGVSPVFNGNSSQAQSPRLRGRNGSDIPFGNLSRYGCPLPVRISRTGKPPLRILGSTPVVMSDRLPTFRPIGAVTHTSL